jgi:hypothetical protein
VPDLLSTNISALFISRPAGTVPLSAGVVLRVTEFMAEKWRQKHQRQIHISAPIFLPFFPALGASVAFPLAMTRNRGLAGMGRLI